MDFTVREVQIILQFRSDLLETIGKSDYHDEFLIRWLRARELDTTKAKEMLLKYLDWMQNSQNLQPIRSWIIPKPIMDTLQGKVLGTDRAGRQVLWAHLGRWDVGKLVNLGLRDDCFRFFYKLLDHLAYGITDDIEPDTLPLPFIALLDMSNLHLGMLTLGFVQFVSRLLKEIEEYYPESVCKIFVINAPYIFSFFYNLAKPILSERTCAKMIVFDSNQNKWKPALFDMLPIETIPAEYGGNGISVFD